MISEFLFHENDAGKDEMSNYVNLKIEIRQLLKDKFNRKVLSEVLLDLRKDVAGQTQTRLFKLYQDLGLHHDEFSKLKSWRWEIVSKAILNLTQMQVEEAYSFVVKFINDKRPTIRKQAEIAVATLRTEGIDYFLDTTKHKISEWQQLKLMDVLRNQKDYQPPRFKSWLTSTNRHVVLFALRLIKYYNQNDSNAALIELVKHKNNQIKEEAIGCIREFYIVEALPTLKLVFWKCSTDVKISILNAIGALGSETDLEFLQLIEKKESNFSVRSKAHASINAIAPDSIMPSKGVINSSKYTVPEDLKIETKEEQFDQIEIEESSVPDSSIQNTEKVEEAEPISEPPITEKLTIDWNFPIKEINPVIEESDSEKQVDAALDTKGETGPDMFEATPLEEENLCFDFLPFVVQTRLQTETDASKEEDRARDGAEVNSGKPSGERVEEDQKKKPSRAITEEELAFLPIVTDTVEENAEVETANDDGEEIISLHEIQVRHAIVTSIEDIEVVFETIEPVTSTQKPEQATTYSEFNTPEVLEASVIYYEVDAISENEPEDSAAELPDSYFLSHTLETPEEDTMDVMSNANHQSFQFNDNMEPQDEQKFKKIIQSLIDFEDSKLSKDTPCAFQNGPLLDFGDEFIDSSTLSANSTEITGEMKADTHSDKEDDRQLEDQNARFSIPKAIHSDGLLEEIVELKENTEESRMQLLDDVTEMGDEREIPLLNELLVNEKYTTVKDRVKRLIKRFSEGDKQPVAEILLKPFNVFEDLFRTCDTEAKLILMDEIVAVGDASEIVFLEGLLEDEENEISNKAAHILEELRAKLSATVEPKTTSETVLTLNQTPIAEMEVLIEEETLAEYDSLMEELQIEPPQASEVFDLSFELSEPLDSFLDEEIPLPEKSNSQDSIFGQIFSFSNKIMGKLNG